MKETDIKPVLVLLAALPVLVASATIRATPFDPAPNFVAQPAASPTHVVDAEQLVLAEPTPTRTALPFPTRTPLSQLAEPAVMLAPAPSATPSPTSVPAVSQVAAAVQPPPSIAHTSASASQLPTKGTQLLVPGGTRVVWGGCASDGKCYPYNFYWAPTLEVVMQSGEAPDKVQHELCHAHQHLTINGGAPLPPSDYDLQSWYRTGEGRSFVRMSRSAGWPWSHSAVNGLEDFAWTCAYWFVDPDYLQRVSPHRYYWAQRNLR